MTVELIAAVVSGIVSIMTALGVLVVSLRNGRTIRADAISKDEQLERIHVLVNSRLSEALREISDLRQYIARLSGDPADAVLADKAAIDSQSTKGPVLEPKVP